MKVYQRDEFKGGWFLGSFTPTALPHLDQNAFEVGIVKHAKGEEWPVHYHEQCDEVNYLISGRMIIQGQEIGPDTIFVLERFEVANPEFLEDCVICCVKTPSVPGDKVVVNGPSGIDLLHGSVPDDVGLGLGEIVGTTPWEDEIKQIHVPELSDKGFEDTRSILQQIADQMPEKLPEDLAEKLEKILKKDDILTGGFKQEEKPTRLYTNRIMSLLSEFCHREFDELDTHLDHEQALMELLVIYTYHWREIEEELKA